MDILKAHFLPEHLASEIYFSLEGSSMKKFLVLLFVLVLTGCTMRMAVFSPHPPDNNDHRQSTRNADCLECHDDIIGLREHTATDNCMRCHRIVKGV